MTFQEMINPKISLQSKLHRNLRSNINDGLSLAIIVSIGLFPLIAAQGLKTLFWLLILSFFFNKDFVTNIKSNALIMMLCLQYPVVNIVTEIISLDDIDISQNALDLFAPWIFGIISIVLCAGFFDLKKSVLITKYAMPIGVIIAFFYLSYLWIKVGGTGRIGIESLAVFIVPLIMTHFVFVYLFNFAPSNKRNILVQFCAIAMIFIVSLVFTQTRGILLAQIVTSFLLTLLIWRNIGMQHVLPIITSAVVILAVGLSYQIHIDKAAFERIKNIKSAAEAWLLPEHTEVIHDYKLMSSETSRSDNLITSLEKTSEKIERSGGYRLKMWATALSELESNPMKIRGTSGETRLLALAEDPDLRRFSHVHNIYLSWLLWGGPIVLASGLVFLTSPLIIMLVDKRTLKEMVYIPLSLTIFWAVSMIFDSFLKQVGIFHMYIPLIFVTHLATRHQRS